VLVVDQSKSPGSSPESKPKLNESQRLSQVSGNYQSSKVLKEESDDDMDIDSMSEDE